VYCDADAAVVVELECVDAVVLSSIAYGSENGSDVTPHHSET